MEKIELTKLFKEAPVQVTMRRATFDRLQIRPQINYRGRTQDEVFFQKQDGANVEYEIVRRMDFEPEGVFEITAVLHRAPHARRRICRTGYRFPRIFAYAYR